MYRNLKKNTKKYSIEKKDVYETNQITHQLNVVNCS